MSEQQTSPEPASPENVQPSDSGVNPRGPMRNIAIGLVSVVVLFGLFYGYTYIQVSAAVDNLTVEPSDYRFTNLAIFPPSADLIVVADVTNNSGYAMEMAVDLDLYADSTYITTFSAVGQQIQANGVSSITMTCHLDTESFTALSSAAGATPKFSGTLTVTHKIGGLIPVTTTKTVSDLSLS